MDGINFLPLDGMALPLHSNKALTFVTDSVLILALWVVDVIKGNKQHFG